MPDDEAHDLLEQLFKHMASEEVIYRHRWEEGTLLIWDNRCLVHRATGGYDGYRRLLQRVTIADTTTAVA
jgi:taurine dioxygenase